uniref:8-amino-7-oxononanoate synthase n=1 Tax=Candidatus Kentrum eta TaxID=2126337 RepID=A0A450UC51_9GAMM|nr:MAG: 8-amino-7-oxononanoate synthase [Candidatus Kentron sp. H]VFJ90915.1 MAG: 8-amino-7-oxononanoate synthase [Candidatus Kentron sp. H]VFJ97925.1 MAG: 8-amino-7-oxononanoate synthase [Candidatus Kentron sp. H]
MQNHPDNPAASLKDVLLPLLQENERAGLRRVRPILATPQDVTVEIDGQRYLSFCSNNYLGLASDPRVIAAFRQAADRYGVGSGAASVVAGHYRAHHALEEELAAFTGRERALLFSTGYMANLGIVSTLAGRGDEIYQDRLNHASLLDAAALSRARLRRYAHADPKALAEALSRGKGGGRRLIATDGVFSMDGDIAPLPELAAIAKQHDAWPVVDDAHGLGVLGENGGGTLEHFGLDANDVPLLMGTLGKALGTFGAFVAGEETVIEYLMQKARPFIFTTALPPAVAEAARESLAIVREESWRREHLRALVARFRAGAKSLGLTLEESATPIQPVLVGEAKQAVAISTALRERGLFVQAIRPPTVPKDTARLRITFSATHEAGQVDRLLDGLSEVFS